MDKKSIPQIALLGAFLGFLAAGTAHAATASLYFSPSSGNYHKGENFSVSVLVRSDASVNAAQGVLTFPTRYLEVIRIGRTSSVVNLWVQEPSFSNAGEVGNISFEGVVLNPGFTGPAGKVIDVTFRVKGEGAADLKFLRAAILANDGLGTNVTALNGGAGFALLASRTPQEEGAPTGPSPQVLILKEVPREAAGGILELWEILPYWIKVSVLVLVGIATIILSLVFLSFGLIVLIYLWKYALSRREEILKKSGLWLKLTWHRARRATKQFIRWTRQEEREVSGDIEYAIEQIQKDFREVSRRRPPPFWQVVRDYWVSIGKIVKRFFTKNEK